MTAGGPLLVLDTATTRALVALGDPTGIREADRWAAGHRHGEELLARVEALLAAAGIAPSDLGGIVVGTGPGAFTGLRVGIATAKGLAHALRVPIAGVPTGAALLAAAAGRAGVAVEPGRIVLIQPAGPSDRVVVRPGATPAILPGGTDPEVDRSELLVAVDLDDRAPAGAVALGALALEGLAAALLAAGRPRIEAGGDDLARLVPEYVTLPRGVLAAPPADDGVAVEGGCHGVPPAPGPGEPPR